MIGRFFVIFLSVFAALGGVGVWMIKRSEKKGTSEKDDVLSEKVVNNVFDLEDRFNRARYMDKDGN